MTRMDKTKRLLAAYLIEKQPAMQKQQQIRQRIPTAATAPDPEQIMRQTDEIFQKVFRAQQKCLQKQLKEIAVQ